MRFFGTRKLNTLLHRHLRQLWPWSEVLHVEHWIVRHIRQQSWSERQIERIVGIVLKVFRRRDALGPLRESRLRVACLMVTSQEMRSRGQIKGERRTVQLRQIFEMSFQLGNVLAELRPRPRCRSHHHELKTWYSIRCSHSQLLLNALSMFCSLRAFSLTVHGAFGKPCSLQGRSRILWMGVSKMART